VPLAGRLTTQRELLAACLRQMLWLLAEEFESARL